MADRGYNPQQIQQQQANSIRRQESSPTIENSTQNEERYNEAAISSVPSEPQAFEKIVNFCSQYANWIAWTITLASAIGAFLNFQSDLKRAESDIKSNKVLVDKNTDKLINLDKVYTASNKDISHIQNDISNIEKTIEKSNEKLDQVSIKQFKLEYASRKNTANK